MSPLLRSFLEESTANYGLSQARNYDVASYPVTTLHGNVDAAGSSRTASSEECEVQDHCTPVPPQHSYRHGAVAMTPKTSWTDDQPDPMWATEVGKEAETPELVPSLGMFFGDAFNVDSSAPLSSNASAFTTSFSNKEGSTGRLRRNNGMEEEDPDDPNRILEFFLKSSAGSEPAPSWPSREGDFPSMDKEAMVPADFVFDEDLFTDLQAGKGYGNGEGLESSPNVLEQSARLMPLSSPSSSSSSYMLDSSAAVGSTSTAAAGLQSSSDKSHRAQGNGALLNRAFNGTMAMPSPFDPSSSGAGSRNGSVLSLPGQSPMSLGQDSGEEDFEDKFSLSELDIFLPPPPKFKKYTTSGESLSPSGAATDVAKPSGVMGQGFSSDVSPQNSPGPAASSYGLMPHTTGPYKAQGSASFAHHQMRQDSSPYGTQGQAERDAEDDDDSKYSAHQYRPGTPHSDDLTPDDFAVVENHDGSRSIHIADTVKIRVPRDFYLGLTLDRDKLIDMPIDDFNLLLQRAALGDREVAYMKEWRRKGKNKKAAKIARKRKRDEMGDLEVEVDSLKNKVVACQSERAAVLKELEEMKARADSLERELLTACARESGAGVLGSKLHHLLLSSKLNGLFMMPRVAQPTQ